jgi:uncharacterized protein (DUF4415 family)
MPKIKPLTNAEGGVRELTTADFKRMRPFTEEEKARFRGPHTIKHVSDAEYEASKRRPGERGKQVAPTKKLVTMRLSANVLEHFRAGGPGWQTRIDETLQRAVKRRPATAPHEPEDEDHLQGVRAGCATRMLTGARGAEDEGMTSTKRKART